MDTEELNTTLEDAEHLAKTAGRVAATAVIATSLTAVLSEPPRAELITLPEPEPIVQMYSPYADEVEPAETEDDDAEPNRWRRLLKLLKFLAVALLLAGTLVLGMLKGCVGCSAGLLLPSDDPKQEEQAQEPSEEEAETNQQAPSA